MKTEAGDRGDRFSVINQIKDETKKKELRAEDDEEDFLDEGKLGHIQYAASCLIPKMFSIIS